MPKPRYFDPTDLSEAYGYVYDPDFPGARHSREVGLSPLPLHIPWRTNPPRKKEEPVNTPSPLDLARRHRDTDESAEAAVTVVSTERVPLDVNGWRVANGLEPRFYNHAVCEHLSDGTTRYRCTYPVSDGECGYVAKKMGVMKARHLGFHKPGGRKRAGGSFGDANGGAATGAATGAADPALAALLSRLTEAAQAIAERDELREAVAQLKVDLAAARRSNTAHQKREAQHQEQIADLRRELDELAGVKHLLTALRGKI